MNMQLAATTDAPARARAAVNASLRDDPRAEAASLATSEVVTNAVLHDCRDARESIELRLSEAGDRLRVEVLNDAATGSAVDDVVDRRAADDIDGVIGGWGLGIVGTLSERWGVERAGRQMLVWFEL
jgi:anti-sigma regulatory factor (Ser/Thr protein kinase)